MSDLTHVEVLWLEKQAEHWIRFGRAAEEQILDRRRRVLSFAPGSIFAFVRWAANDYGTVASRIDILRDRSVCTTRRRHFVADVRLAQGQARAADDRHR